MSGHTPHTHELGGKFMPMSLHEKKKNILPAYKEEYRARTCQCNQSDYIGLVTLDFNGATELLLTPVVKVKQKNPANCFEASLRSTHQT